MSRIPLLPTDVAKLKPAFASHMIAALIFFDNGFALSTGTIMEIFLEKFDLMLIALSFMELQITFWAGFYLTAGAYELVISIFDQDSFTILDKAKELVWVL
jgi:hypothetical protein